MSHLSFSSLPLETKIIKNLDSLGFHEMTPIQEQSLKFVLNNQDVLAQAETGSGKTAVFGLGVISKLNPSDKRTQALVLCPTRELAEQVASDFRRFARAIPNIKITTLCGGTPIAPQIASLQHEAHCIIGTPGRIEDHLGRKSLNLRSVHTFVLDEADRMLEMGFSDSIDMVVSKLPPRRQTLLFSATYPDNIQQLSQHMQYKPVTVKVKSKKEGSNILEKFIEVDTQNKVHTLKKILSERKQGSTVVFCNTKQTCSTLVESLKIAGFSAQAIHGDLEQYERNQVLLMFSNGSTPVLVATDMASRGLDVKNLNTVINFDMAHDAAVHVHRTGRTGRAGNTGSAYSLVEAKQMHKVDLIEELTGKKIPFIGLDEICTSQNEQSTMEMVSLQISGGKKNKLRAGDILGALTKQSHLKGSDVGKINIFDFFSVVAIPVEKASLAFKILTNDKVKGRFFKVKYLSPSSR